VGQPIVGQLVSEHDSSKMQERTGPNPMGM
jgi:hypothetical protein